MARRVGVFGGAFDPPHVAHGALARAAVDQLALDELRILPTGQAWHKSRPLTAPEHRLAMTRLAFAGVPHAVVDDRELRRSGPTYTVDTLRELQAEQPAAELFLLMGEDQAGALTRWHDWETVVALAVICVATRAAAPGEARPALPPQARTRAIVMPPMAASATGIRSLVRSGAPIADLVAPPVARYIAHHHLYRPA